MDQAHHLGLVSGLALAVAAALARYWCCTGGSAEPRSPIAAGRSTDIACPRPLPTTGISLNEAFSPKAISALSARFCRVPLMVAAL